MPCRLEYCSVVIEIGGIMGYCEICGREVKHKNELKKCDECGRVYCFNCESIYYGNMCDECK